MVRTTSITVPSSVRSDFARRRGAKKDRCFCFFCNSVKLLNDEDLERHGAGHAFAAAYIDGARSANLRARAARANRPLPGYKDATCQIWSRSAQNCGRA